MMASRPGKITTGLTLFEKVIDCDHRTRRAMKLMLTATVCMVIPLLCVTALAMDAGAAGALGSSVAGAVAGAVAVRKRRRRRGQRGLRQ